MGDFCDRRCLHIGERFTVATVEQFATLATWRRTASLSVFGLIAILAVLIVVGAAILSWDPLKVAVDRPSSGFGRRQRTPRLGASTRWGERGRSMADRLLLDVQDVAELLALAGEAAAEGELAEHVRHVGIQQEFLNF